MHQKAKQLTKGSAWAMGVLHQLHAAVRKKRPDIWRAKSFLLHHDNAPAHSARVIHNFLAKKRHAPCLTGSVLSGFGAMQFWAFLKIENSHERTSCKNQQRS